MDGWDLIYAVEKDDLAQAKELLASGLSPNETSMTGDRALCVAADKGKISFVELLLEAGADPNKADEKVTMDKGATPLALAAARGFCEVVRLLLASGANPSLPSKFKETPLEAAVFGGFPLIVQLLLDGGASIDAPTGFDEKTALMVACEYRQKEIVELLLAHGASVLTKCRKGKTALHYGAGFPSGPAGKSVITEMLLTAGASANEKDRGGETPIFGAARWEDDRVLSLLLTSGAEVNVFNNSGETPLLAASKYNTHPLVVKLLAEAGADVSARGENETTAMHLLCKKDDLPVDGIAALLEAGAPVGAKDAQGRTPLHDLFVGLGDGSKKEEKALLLVAAGAPVTGLLHGAARSCTVKVCQILIEKGAKIDEKDDWERTALHWVAHDNKIQLIEYLLSAGAAVDNTDDKGHSPLHLTCRQRHLKACQMLIMAGADLRLANSYGRLPLYYCEKDFIDELSKSLPQVIDVYEQMESEGRENLRCCHKGTSLDKRDSCVHCGWTTEANEEERAIHCPWCLLLSLTISDYKVLHGNPEIPTTDTEVEFTYTCGHCNLIFVNGWNAMNTKRPHITEKGTRTSWLSEDGGVNWQRHWGLEE